MHPELKHGLIFAVANVPLYLVLGWVFFRSWAGFFEAVGYVLTPDWVSLFRGRSIEDTWETLKVFIFVGLSVLLVYQEHHRWHQHHDPPLPSAQAATVVD